MTQDWNDVLDAFEAGVDASVSRYLSYEDVEIPEAIAIPTDLGPLPRDLEPRARHVLARLRETEAKLARIPRPGPSPRRARFTASDDVSGTFEHRM